MNTYYRAEAWNGGIARKFKSYHAYDAQGKRVIVRMGIEVMERS